MILTIIGFWGAYPNKNEATSAYLLEQSGFRLLIDCGSGALSLLQNYIPLHQLDALILSHYHHDHIADVGSLQYSMLVNHQLQKRSKILPIYANDKDDEKFQSLHFHDFTEGRSINENDQLQIGPWQVTFCQTNHPAYCLAMKFKDITSGKTIVYSADTSWCDNLVPFSKNANILIYETSLYDEQLAKITGHSTPSDAALLAGLANVETLVLTHLPHFGDHSELIRIAKEQFDGHVMLAKTGLTFEL
ncbi:MBL fold metallo-hydrolase [Bacillus sp. JCM 19034]|uniref:MBL fold metallo-hydrolase n=1 Tax=Bacillus sp. JCM 19034 TaxID=1481928 RepID=UPI000781BDDE|nr:MBL fold metallo-hydrolase [Bacillus sp. JCM 19034]